MTVRLLLFLRRKSAAAIEVGHDFLITVAPFYAIIATKLVADGVLRGAERMNYFMIATFTDLALRVGFAFLLASTYLGARGIWWAWPIGWIIAVGMSFAFYFVGVWKKKKPKASSDDHA